MDRIFQIVTEIRTPLMFAALVFLGAFFTLRLLIKRNTFPKLSERNWFALLKQGMFLLFIFMTVAAGLGFAGYVWGPSQTSLTRHDSSNDTANVTPIEREDTACRWVWIFLGRFSRSQARYEVPEAFRYLENESLKYPIPRVGDSIVVISKRTQIVAGYAKAESSKKCDRMLDPPERYRPETARDFEAGVIPIGRIVTVNKTAFLPSENSDPVYVWALVGASH
jgi:hypothetical protein